MGLQGSTSTVRISSRASCSTTGCCGLTVSSTPVLKDSDPTEVFESERLSLLNSCSIRCGAAERHG